jgi:hypothetical protein
VNVQERFDESDPFERKILEDVRTVGWSVVLIPEDDEGVGFAFSVGLFHSFQHPEIIIFGLRLETMQGIINHVGRQIQAGGAFNAHREYHDVIEHFPVAFIPISRANFREYLGTAMWFYQNEGFETLQLIYPDRQRRFPWDSGVHPRFLEQQPLLGELPKEKS